MALTQKEIEQLATLARLKIADEEVDELSAKLSGIIDFFEKLNAVDTDGVTPMAHPLDMVQRLRVDDVSETNQREKYQQVAPAVESGLYLVPKVIE